MRKGISLIRVVMMLVLASWACLLIVTIYSSTNAHYHEVQNLLTLRGANINYVEQLQHTLDTDGLIQEGVFEETQVIGYHDVTVYCTVTSAGSEGYYYVNIKSNIKNVKAAVSELNVLLYKGVTV